MTEQLTHTHNVGFSSGSGLRVHLPMQEMWAQSLEKEMEAHSSILAWEIPWTEGPKGLQSMRLQRFGHDLVTKQQQPHRM